MIADAYLGSVIVILVVVAIIVWVNRRVDGRADDRVAVIENDRYAKCGTILGEPCPIECDNVTVMCPMQYVDAEDTCC